MCHLTNMCTRLVAEIGVGGGELSVLVYVTIVAKLVRHSVTRLVNW